MKSYPDLPEANLLTPVLLWEEASHTQFHMENSLGTVGSSWVWAEPLEASPLRSSQSLWSTWRVSLSVRMVHSTVSEPWAYVQCAVSIWCLKVLTKSATKARPWPDPMLVGNPTLGTITLRRHWATSDALSVQIGKAFIHLKNVHTMRFHFSEVHSQVFKGQCAFQLNPWNTREAALTCEQAAWPRWVAWCGGLPECVPAPPVPIICHLAILTSSFQSWWPLPLWLTRQLLSLFYQASLSSLGLSVYSIVISRQW